MTVVYDGSLAGLLTVVFDAVAERLAIDRVERASRYAPEMFDAPLRVGTDEARATRVWRGLGKLEGFDVELVLRGYLFATPQSDADVVHLVRRVFAEGAGAAEDYRDEAVFRCRRVYKKMFREIHRTHAFVRFSESTDGLYFAEVQPDFDVLPLAVEHFEQRYQDQEWMIFDALRGYGYWCAAGSARAQRVTPPDASDAPAASAPGEADLADASHLPSVAAAHEDGFRRLWATYFDSVDIGERANPKLHRAHVPLRYWKLLTEKAPANRA